MKEGIIKYKFEHLSGEPVKDSSIKNIKKIRSILYGYGFIGVHKDGLGYGNLSVRYAKKFGAIKGANENSFLISGTQTGHLKDTDTSHYVLVLSTDFNKFSLTSTGVVKPSSESITHAIIYQLDKKIKAVIHIHHDSLWKFMIKNGMTATDHATYGSKKMLQSIQNIYSNIDPLLSPVFAMRGHKGGIISFGVNLNSALKVIEHIYRKHERESK